jgi:hypothetical protein
LPRHIDLKVCGVAGSRIRSRVDSWSLDPVPPHFAWLREHAANAKHSLTFAAAEVRTEIAVLGSIDLAQANGEHRAWTCMLKVLEDGEMDGLGGWFDCMLSESVPMTNSPLAAERIARDQALFPIDPPLKVRAGEALSVTISARFDGSALAWTVENRQTRERRRHSTWRSEILSPEARAVTSTRIPTIGNAGEARRLALSLTDGQRTLREIEDAVLAAFPRLFPGEAEIRRFIQTELHRNQR